MSNFPAAACALGRNANNETRPSPTDRSRSRNARYEPVRSRRRSSDPARDRTHRPRPTCGAGTGHAARRVGADAQAARRDRAEDGRRQARGRGRRTPARPRRVRRRPHPRRDEPLAPGAVGRARDSCQTPARRAEGVSGPRRPAGEEVARPGEAGARPAPAVATARPLLRLPPGGRSPPIARRPAVRARRIPRGRRRVAAAPARRRRGRGLPQLEGRPGTRPRASCSRSSLRPTCRARIWSSTRSK